MLKKQDAYWLEFSVHYWTFLLMAINVAIMLILYLPQSNSVMHTYKRNRIELHLLAGVTSDCSLTGLLLLFSFTVSSTEGLTAACAAAFGLF